MKKLLLLPLLAAGMLLTSAFLSADLAFIVTMQGNDREDLVSEGIKPHELTTLIIDTNSKDVSVEAFEIFHARGKSPIDGATVTGSSYDVSNFRKAAKSGDRLVINITRVSGPKGSIPMKDALIQIPIR